MKKDLLAYLSDIPVNVDYGYVSFNDYKIREINVSKNRVEVIRDGHVFGGNSCYHTSNKRFFSAFNGCDNDFIDITKSNSSQNNIVGDFRKYKSLSYMDIQEIAGILLCYIDLIDNYFSLNSNIKIKYKEVRGDKYLYNTDGDRLVHDNLEITIHFILSIEDKGREIKNTFTLGGNNYNFFCGREVEIIQFCQLTYYLLFYVNERIDLTNNTKILLEPDVAGTLFHEAVGHFCEADSIDSFNHITRNSKIGSSQLFFSDEACEGTNGWSMFDDEGTKCNKQTLIKAGRIVGRINSKMTAQKFKEIPNGNARALDYEHIPICRMRHTKLYSGKYCVQDIVRHNENVLLLMNSMGGTSGENFTVRSRFGVQLKKGIIIGVKKNITLFGNIFTSLHHIAAVCNDSKIINSYNGCGKMDQYPLSVSYSSPSIFFEGGLIIKDDNRK